MTPLMRQYQDIKDRYPDEILLFQVGDFYEIFNQDAQRVAPVLGIVLTKRGMHEGKPIPLCGFPRHAADTHIIKLVQQGFRVVICDQTTTAQPGKAIERAVTAVLTPGTLVDVTLLEEKSPNYLAAFAYNEHAVGLLFLEILTGRGYLTSIDVGQRALLEAELARFAPKEILIASSDERSEKFLRTSSYVTTRHKIEDDAAQSSTMHAWLHKRCDAHALISISPVLQRVSELVYGYLGKNNPAALEQVTQLSPYKPDDFLMLDAATQRNLELVINNIDGSSNSTLFEVLDGALTSMGSRMIKRWLLRPLADRAAIEVRQQHVQNFIEHAQLHQEIGPLLRTIGDFERLIGRIALKRAQQSDYIQLKLVLSVVPKLMKLVPPALVSAIFAHTANMQELYEKLSVMLNDDQNRDWFIKSGYHDELDRLRALVDSGAQAIATLELQEQERTGIHSLKIRMNQHGYGIEVTKPNLHLVPNDYVRLQTLMNRERFTTQPLKDLEYDIRRAQVDSTAIEQELFAQLLQFACGHIATLQQIAQELAHIDAYLGLAQVAIAHRYVRPTFSIADCIIHAGRHPVVEAQIRARGKGQFIANNLELTQSVPVWVITGPNMGGKSTFLRQNALIVIMAQMGSFVPAASAQLPIFDRIFTRIGAADRVAQGKSTFLVEMEETALICNQATEKSLVILDEVGRGTSTYDGLAIAQAVLEYIYTKIKARCLFATHYHELTELHESYPGMLAYHAASKQTHHGIVLLHEIRPGCAQGSFGIDVAKSAHVPQEIIVRAQEILNKLHAQPRTEPGTLTSMNAQTEKFVPAIPEHQMLAQALQEVDLDNLSPRQAFDLVCKLKQMV